MAARTTAGREARTLDRRPYTADVTSVLAQSTSVAPEPGAERQPPIYLDYNATTPLDPAVAEAMEPFMRSRFGNPSSAHEYGATARVAVERARAQVARLLGAHLAEIVFNSSGSEATNLALKRLAFASRSPLHDLRLITSAVEHPATIETCRFLERLGCHVTVLPSTGMESLSSTRSGRHFANPRSRSGTSASSAAAAATSPPAFPRSPPRPARPATTERRAHHRYSRRWDYRPRPPRGAIRLSVGRFTTEAEIERAAVLLTTHGRQVGAAHNPNKEPV
jgi:aminotransferase class V